MILDAPFATREHILSAFRPGGDVLSDTPLKTLRKRGAVSKGVSVPLRAEGRFSGRHVVYSSLCVHAARLSRHGRHDDAAALAQAAQEVEAYPVAHLAAQLVARGDDDAPEVLELALWTEQALTPFRTALNRFLRIRTAVVYEVAPDVVILADETGIWPASRDVIPDHFARPGMPLSLVIEDLGNAGVLISVRQGVQLGEESPSWAAMPVRFSVDTPVLTPITPTPSSETLSAALLDALGSLRAEGLTPSLEVVALAQRVVTGELTPDGLRAEIARLHSARTSAARAKAAPQGGRASTRGRNHRRAS